MVGVELDMVKTIDLLKYRTQTHLFQLFSYNLLVDGEAVPVADLITAPKTLQGGCSSSRHDRCFPDMVKLLAYPVMMPK